MKVIFKISFSHSKERSGGVGGETPQLSILPKPYNLFFFLKIN